jgi:23S rRNA pseudouridine1911/1915/1917 synthase
MNENESIYQWLIQEHEHEQRIDKFITEQLENMASRTQVQQWLKDGQVTVNGKFIKANHKLSAGEEVICHVPKPSELSIPAEDIPLDVVFEDSAVVVVNKPRGMVVHPAPGHYTGTLVNALLFHCNDLSGINGWMRPGIVHRIDKDTSGLLMVAKHDQAHQSLAAQLQAHTVIRHYYALVQGVIAHDMGTIDAPIGRDPYDRQAMTVIERNSKDAVTHFVVVERFREHTLVQLKLETGRTHQIRVHMKYIGHPLIGDPKYGSAKSASMMQGQALHAAVLGFKHPLSDEMLSFEVPLPSDMSDCIAWLRKREGTIH